MKTEERFFCPDANKSGSQVQFGVENEEYLEKILYQLSLYHVKYLKD